jgi:hypothetical protein
MTGYACKGIATIALLVLLLGLPGWAVGQEAMPVLDPAGFTTEVTNPYFPLPPGSTRVYEGEEIDDAGERHTFRIEERVLDEAYSVTRIAVVVLEVTEYEDGEIVEVTRDYHAQDAEGNVWYFGEDVDNYEDGVLVDHDGSWIAGEGENRASLFMPAEPRVFATLLQEQAPGEAEDISTVVETGLTVTVPAGTFTDCVKTVDVNPLEATSEFKHYCPGAGVVREENADGVIELVSLALDGGTPEAGQ